MTPALLVFARAPVPGRTKTRLIPALGAEGAARLQAVLLEDALARARAAAPSVLELWGTGGDPDGLLAAAAARHGARLRRQPGGDLGARMQRALARATAGGQPAMIMGTDSPGLAPSSIREAGRMLATSDAVIGPAMDGGYVLLGLHRAEESLFTGIDWGTDRVLGATRERIRRLGWRLAELDEQWDVDRPEDLEQLAALGAGWGETITRATGSRGTS